MTPRQLNIYANEYNIRKNEEVELHKLKQKEMLHIAYLNAVWTSRFVWIKKVPTFEKLINEKTKKEMTDKEMLENVKKLNDILGGTLERR